MLEPDYEYYILKKGEIVQEGDEVDISANYNDEPKWVDAANTVGTPAPDPQYMSHRLYRRKVLKPVAGRWTKITPENLPAETWILATDGHDWYKFWVGEDLLMRNSKSDEDGFEWHEMTHFSLPNLPKIEKQWQRIR